MYGIDYLKRKLKEKSEGVSKRYAYYDMHKRAREFGISDPGNLHWYKPVLGWCAKAVNSLADRLQVGEFRNDLFNMNEIYRLNNGDILFDSAMRAALIGSCSFIYVSADEDGYPRLQVIDGANATGIIDPQTNLLKEGYAVLEREDDWFHGKVVRDAYFTSEYTYVYEKGEEIMRVPNPAKYALLVPIIYRPGATRPFGRSRISRSCMSLVDGAMRTIKRAEVSAEFYAFPQKYVTGLDPDAQKMEKWKATISSMLTFTKDEDGDRPVVGQFQSAAMTPHNDMLRMFASAFAGETGLTSDDLGFVSANPMSVEAIKASHEQLRLEAVRARKEFGIGFINAGYLAVSVKDKMAYERSRIYDTKLMWQPIFAVDISNLGVLGDAVLKMQQAAPGLITEDKIRELTGIG